MKRCLWPRTTPERPRAATRDPALDLAHRRRRGRGRRGAQVRAACVVRLADARRHGPSRRQSRRRDGADRHHCVAFPGRRVVARGRRRCSDSRAATSRRSGRDLPSASRFHRSSLRRRRTPACDGDGRRRGARATCGSEVRPRRGPPDHGGGGSASRVRRVCQPSDGRTDVGAARRRSTTPIVPASLRRALVVRDGGCRFDACDRPAAWTDAHHIVHWAGGGPTSLSNLVLLCRRHHRAVHEGKVAAPRAP